MKVYAALFVNGVEEGLRVPVEAMPMGGNQYRIKSMAVGPSRTAGQATVRIFPSETSQACIHEFADAPPLEVSPAPLDSPKGVR